jgi:hypothetical protein
LKAAGETVPSAIQIQCIEILLFILESFGGICSISA